MKFKFMYLFILLFSLSSCMNEYSAFDKRLEGSWIFIKRNSKPDSLQYDTIQFFNNSTFWHSSSYCMEKEVEQFRTEEGYIVLENNEIIPYVFTNDTLLNLNWVQCSEYFQSIFGGDVKYFIQYRRI